MDKLQYITVYEGMKQKRKHHFELSKSFPQETVISKDQITVILFRNRQFLIYFFFY